MSDRIANFATLLLVAGGLIIAGLLVERELVEPEQDVRGQKVVLNALEPVWRADSGGVIGEPNAPMVIVEFSDFQCPACAAAQDGLRRLLRSYPGQVAVRYRHFPLSTIHPHAFAAANAAECAGAQGRFEAYHDLLFDQQQRIGVVGWTQFAAAAAVPDTAAFRSCVEEQRFRDRVLRDRGAGERVGVSGTPTFLFQGRMISGADAPKQLEIWLRDALGSR